MAPPSAASARWRRRGCDGGGDRRRPARERHVHGLHLGDLAEKILRADMRTRADAGAAVGEALMARRSSTEKPLFLVAVSLTARIAHFCPENRGLRSILPPDCHPRATLTPPSLDRLGAKLARGGAVPAMAIGGSPAREERVMDELEELTRQGRRARGGAAKDRAMERSLSARNLSAAGLSAGARSAGGQWHDAGRHQRGLHAACRRGSRQDCSRGTRSEMRAARREWLILAGPSQGGRIRAPPFHHGGGLEPHLLTSLLSRPFAAPQNQYRRSGTGLLSP